MATTSSPPPLPPQHAPTTYYMAPETPWQPQQQVLQEKGPHVDQERFESKPRPPLTERNICVRWLCCACCLPVWARWVLWFIIVSVIIVIIVLAALLATFTMPTIDFAGVTSSPTNQSEISYNGHVLNFNFGLLIHIANPNVLGIDLSQINATAYYPDNTSPSGQLKLGEGYMDYQYVPPHYNENFTFPFALQYDPFGDSHTTILNILVDKCGLTGSEPQDLTVDYTINLAAKVLFVKVYPTISSSASFKCPLTEAGLPSLGGSGSSLNGIFGR